LQSRVQSIDAWAKKSGQPASDLAHALAAFHAKVGPSGLVAAVLSHHECVTPTVADVVTLFDLMPAVAEAWDGVAPCSRAASPASARRPPPRSPRAA